MKNEKGRIFEIIRVKCNVLLNVFEKLSKYLTERTKINKNIKSQISHLRAMKEQQNTMKSKDAFNIMQMNNLENETDDHEDEKFESIDLRNSRLEDNESFEENKTEEEKDHFKKFPSDLEKNPFKEKPNLITHSYLKTFKDPHPDLVGYLICIKCGHNGNFSIYEKSLYEKHLVKAGFIKDSTL